MTLKDMKLEVVQPTPPTDYDHVKEMLEFAGPYGLEVECVVAAMRNCRNGMEVQMACHHALREWDCWPPEYRDEPEGADTIVEVQVRPSMPDAITEFKMRPPHTTPEGNTLYK